MLYSLIVCNTLIADALTIAFHFSSVQGCFLNATLITFIICKILKELSNNLGSILRLGKDVN